jgi:hypothetical protein
VASFKKDANAGRQESTGRAKAAAAAARPVEVMVDGVSAYR